MAVTFRVLAHANHCYPPSTRESALDYEECHPRRNSTAGAGQGWVRISAPVGVMTIDCSNWATREPSSVTTVQSSAQTWEA